MTIQGPRAPVLTATILLPVRDPDEAGAACPGAIRYGMPRDTSPDVERSHILMLRHAGPLQRSAIASSITNWCIESARAGLRRARPHLSQRELNILYVEINYGRHLAQQLREFLDNKP